MLGLIAFFFFLETSGGPAQFPAKDHGSKSDTLIKISRTFRRLAEPSSVTSANFTVELWPWIQTFIEPPRILIILEDQKTRNVQALNTQKRAFGRVWCMLREGWRMHPIPLGKPLINSLILYFPCAIAFLPKTDPRLFLFCSTLLGWISGRALSVRHLLVGHL